MSIKYLPKNNIYTKNSFLKPIQVYSNTVKKTK